MSRQREALPGVLFAPLSPLLEQIPLAPDPAALDFLLAGRDLRTASGRRVSFAPPADDGLDYETRIWRSGVVATRPGNWHDFFNALVWLTFPRSKAALNAGHVAGLAQSRRTGQRGSLRDAITHFDECGALVVASDPSLLALLRAFQWRELFWGRRLDFLCKARCFVFGHATYEQLLQPFRGLTAKAVLYEVGADWFEKSLVEQLAALDERLSGDLAAGACQEAKHFQPLPLLGLPGVTPANACADYYDDLWQFRPGRRAAGV